MEIRTKDTEDVPLAQTLIDCIAASADHEVLVRLDETGSGFVIVVERDRPRVH